MVFSLELSNTLGCWRSYECQTRALFGKNIPFQSFMLWVVHLRGCCTCCLIWQVHSRWLMKMPLFKGSRISLPFYTALALKLQSRLFAPLEPVIEAHHEADTMFVMEKGMLITKGPGSVKTAGDFFGEDAIATWRWRSNADCEQYSKQLFDQCYWRCQQSCIFACIFALWKMRLFDFNCLLGVGPTSTLHWPLNNLCYCIFWASTAHQLWSMLH